MQFGDFIANDLETPQLRITRDQDLVKIAVLAAEPALDAEVGWNTAGVFDAVVGFDFTAGCQRPLRGQRDAIHGFLRARHAEHPWTWPQHQVRKFDWCLPVAALQHLTRCI